MTDELVPNRLVISKKGRQCVQCFSLWEIRNELINRTELGLKDLIQKLTTVRGFRISHFITFNLVPWRKGTLDMMVLTGACGSRPYFS